ncbi:hypothetical protein FK220_011570 [Flavobacteriaceae bacterium TP-CH-4]|uniref:chitinase n=1 Tax=Pelagihabitans pacificus TaxID=2696054 RepID=A0A967ATA3_9FLAO|nr:glycosyl hydrolase family 18 protein [Pelagihabitans pacificus]NHF59984.1 hypothetical protein [Pelagihabitans pacificus]
MKTTLFVFLLVIVSFNPTGTSAQDTVPEATIRDPSDSLYHPKETDSFFKKLLQPFKFRENRNRRDKERIRRFLTERIKDNDLHLSNDSLKIFLDSIVMHLKDSIYAETLGKLQSVRYSCSFLEQAPDTALIAKDRLCLRPKVQIIGWHRSGAGNRFKNYNYKYLTAINLYGYELGIDGSSKNPKSWQEFNEEGGVIALAQNNGVDTYLTIYNESASEVTQFLNNQAARHRLFNTLVKYKASHKITGLTIYFDHITAKDNARFSSFIAEMYNTLDMGADDNFVLNISIPAIDGRNSPGKANAYDFARLNNWVDYYYLRTDSITRSNSASAAPKSPLGATDDVEYGSIQSTIAFYSNANISVSKLVMTVSYSGIQWPVTGFNGMVRPLGRPNDIPYKAIRASFLQNKDLQSVIEQGYDSVSATAFLNVKGSNKKNTPEYTQIWYEDRHSLSRKYEWLLDNKLAGVSIRGLGDDDGYTDLWDVLGASLIQIDSVQVTSSPVEPQEDPKTPFNNSMQKTVTIAIVVVMVLVGIFLVYRKAN